MAMHHTSAPAPKSIPLALPQRVGYASRRARSNAGQSFVYQAAASNGFRYPKASASPDAKGFWHERESKPR